MVCLQLESFQILQENLFTNIMEASDDIRKRGFPLFKFFSSFFFLIIVFGLHWLAQTACKMGETSTILKLHHALKSGFLKIKN